MTKDRFDDIIKVNNLKVSFKSSHWLLLKERLETQALYLQNLYSSKAFELVIFLLLLITFAQQLPNPVKFEFEKDIYIVDKSLHKIDLAQVQPLQKIQKQTKRNRNIAGTHYSIAIATQAEAQEIAKTKAEPIASNNTSTYSVDIKTNNVIAPNLSLDSEGNLLANNSLSALAPIPALEIELEQTTPDLKPKFVNIGAAFIAAKEGEAERWLSMHASVDNNLINTPIDHIYKTAPYSKLAAGFSGGINYDLRAEGVELGTGLSYSSVLYNPKEVKVITGGLNDISEYSLKNIAFTYITIPLNLKFHFLEVGSWSSFAEFGLGLNSILTASYVDTETNLRGNIAPPVEINRAPTPVKSNPVGLLQGGSFADNIFVRASVGLGIQKNFSEKMGLYAALSYNNHFLNTVGPNNDSLDKTSLTLGARYRL